MSQTQTLLTMCIFFFHTSSFCIYYLPIIFDSILLWRAKSKAVQQVVDRLFIWLEIRRKKEHVCLVNWLAQFCCLSTCHTHEFQEWIRIVYGVILFDAHFQSVSIRNVQYNIYEYLFRSRKFVWMKPDEWSWGHYCHANYVHMYCVSGCILFRMRVRQIVFFFSPFIVMAFLHSDTSGFECWIFMNGTVWVYVRNTEIKYRWPIWTTTLNRHLYGKLIGQNGVEFFVFRYNCLTDMNIICS